MKKKKKFNFMWTQTVILKLFCWKVWICQIVSHEPYLQNQKYDI